MDGILSTDGLAAYVAAWLCSAFINKLDDLLLFSAMITPP